jgi:hypothetical protein
VVILLERPVTTAEDSRLWAVWAMADQGVASRHDEQGNLLAEAFGYRDGAGEQGLLVIAEHLLGGKAVGGGSELADAGGHDDYVLLVSVGAIEHPLEVVQVL